MNNWFKLGTVMAVCAGTSLALAQRRPTPDEQANEYRQALMVLLGGNLTPMAGMARDRVPYDAAIVQTNSERVQFLAGMIADAFVRDTSGAELETEALDGIWANKADFDAMSEETQSLAGALLAAVRGGNEASTKQAIGTLAGSCGDCHDQYRSD